MHYTNQNVRRKELFRPITGFYSSFKSGLLGFVVIFGLIIISKVLLFVTNPAKNIIININDYIFSSWGFLIVSFIVFTVKNRRIK